MYLVEKNGSTVMLRDKEQYAAFIHNGWVAVNAARPSGQPSSPPKAEPEKVKYTRTEINRMPVSELQKLGADMGIPNASDKSGSMLKAEIIERLGL